MNQKNGLLLLIACILVVSLSACQTAPTPTTVPPTTAAPTAGVVAYPMPTTPPAPTAYPEPQITSEPGNWSDVMGLLQKGDVTKIIQTRNLNVYLTLKDGRTLKVTEPALDEIARLITQCGDTCKNLSVDNQ